MTRVLSKIVTKRAIPGVMIFDSAGELLYINSGAKSLLSEVDSASRSNTPEFIPLPEELEVLCKELIKTTSESCGTSHEQQMVAIISDGRKTPLSARAFCLDNRREGFGQVHILVLIEKVTEKHHVDLERAKTEYLLTNKELKVLELMCRGYSNREIAAELVISEHTAKDHVKNIMRKMGTSSRSEVIALLS